MSIIWRLHQTVRNAPAKYYQRSSETFVCRLLAQICVDIIRPHLWSFEASRYVKIKCEDSGSNAVSIKRVHYIHNLGYGQWDRLSALFAPTEHMIHACSQVMSSEGHWCGHRRSGGTFDGLNCVWTSFSTMEYTYIRPSSSSMWHVVCQLCSDARYYKDLVHQGNSWL